MLDEVYNYIKDPDKFNDVKGVLKIYKNNENCVKNEVCIKNDNDLPNIVNNLLQFLNGPIFIKFLSILTGILDIEKDFNLFSSTI